MLLRSVAGGSSEVRDRSVTRVTRRGARAKRPSDVTLCAGSAGRRGSSAAPAGAARTGATWSSACSTQTPSVETRTGLSRAWCSSGRSSASRPSRSSTSTTAADVGAQGDRAPRTARDDDTSSLGVEVGERQAARGPVGDGVGEGAAEAEGDDRPERRVRLDGGARLDAARHHALHDGLGHRRAERRRHPLVRTPAARPSSWMSRATPPLSDRARRTRPAAFSATG